MSDLPKFLASEFDSRKVVIHTGKPMVIAEVILSYNSVKELKLLKICGDPPEEKRLQGLLDRMKDWYIFTIHAAI